MIEVGHYKPISLIMPKPSIQSVDEFINRFFAIFDNRANKSPDFSQLEKMFHIDAIITKYDNQKIHTMSVSDFIEPRVALFNNGSLSNFYEWENHSHTAIDHLIANRMCQYQKSDQLNGKSYTGKGIKHFQLILHKNDWKIISILWQDDE